MYVNPHFALDDLGGRHELIRRRPFGLLVAGGPEPLAAHIPFVLHAGEGPLGTLVAHVAARDPIAAAVREGRPLLAVFSGPAAYLSPRWYRDPGLPTYNFLAVHAHGRAEPFDEEEAVLAHLRELVEVHEERFADPWPLDAAPEDYVRPLLAHIAPFRLPIERLDGKVKLSQNRSRADRDGVVEGLRARGREDALAIADAMAAYAYPSEEAQPLLEPPRGR